MAQQLEHVVAALAEDEHLLITVLRMRENEQVAHFCRIDYLDDFEIVELLLISITKHKRHLPVELGLQRIYVKVLGHDVLRHLHRLLAHKQLPLVQTSLE